MMLWASLPRSLPHFSVVGSASLMGCSLCSIESGARQGQSDYLTNNIWHHCWLQSQMLVCECQHLASSLPGLNCSEAHMPL